MIVPSRQGWDIAIKSLPEKQRLAYKRYFADFDQFSEYFYKKEHGRLSRLDRSNVAQMKWALELLEHCDHAGKALKTSADALTASLARTSPEFESLKEVIRDNEKVICKWRSQVTHELLRTKFHLFKGEMRYKVIDSREKYDALVKKVLGRFEKPALPYREQLVKDMKKSMKAINV